MVRVLTVWTIDKAHDRIEPCLHTLILFFVLQVSYLQLVTNLKRFLFSEEAEVCDNIVFILKTMNNICVQFSETDEGKD
jgi:hypothetical protein